MYSYEDRIRAVQLYIKLGKRIGPTLRQLGYPTKNALKSWHREYEQNSDLQVAYVRSRQKYSDNAACEDFFGRLKTELFYPRDWQTTTIEQFIQIVDAYIRWYNEKRIKISLGSLSPIEYRESLGLAT